MACGAAASGARVSVHPVVDEAAVRALAAELFAAHLPGGGWDFGFDRAVRRAGVCDGTRRRITVSRHLCATAGIEEVRQVLLHEIAHAVAGHAAAHGPAWRGTARRIGYTGGRTHDRTIAAAPWIGSCPAGHELQRFRRPGKPVSCATCAPRFSRAHLIRWRRRSEDRLTP